jgi:integrase
MATDIARTRGRPSKFAEYEAFKKRLPKPMGKRPKYLKGVGIYRGNRGDTAWVKINLPHGGLYKGKHHPVNSSLEIKVGSLTSWPWDQLEKKRDDLQGKADRAEPLEEQIAPCFDAVAQDWLQRARVRVKDYVSIRAHVNNHLISFFGNRPVTAMTTADVNRWIVNQLGHFEPGTVKRQLNTLKAILNDAIRSGYIDANPCRHADPIRGITPRQRFLDSEELVRVLAKSEEVAEWLPDLILWCLHSGMRKGEVKALDWSDIRPLEDGRTYAQVKTSKTDQPRIVSCTDTMKQVLERQRKRQVEGDSRVFPISAMTLRRKWEKARALAGLKDVTMHDLRRTHGTHAAAAGVDLRTLAGRIGHTDLTMLQKHYAALVGSADEQAAKIIGDVFDGMVGAKSSDG